LERHRCIAERQEPGSVSQARKYEAQVTITWDAHFLGLAERAAQKSKDPSTKCGAIIVRQDRSIASTGYNGFPRGVSDTPDLYADRETKLRRIVHAEMNAILFAREPLNGYTLYTWPFLTCERCAAHVVQAGIKRVVAPKSNNARWIESFQFARSLFAEAGVNVDEVE
jgi:dCMP deaminase